MIQRLCQCKNSSFITRWASQKERSLIVLTTRAPNQDENPVRRSNHIWNKGFEAIKWSGTRMRRVKRKVNLVGARLLMRFSLWF